MALLVAVPIASGCASGPRATSGLRSTRSVITRDEFAAHNFTTAWDLVNALRTNWLNPRGTDSFTNPGEVLVYIDNVKLGGIESLRTISTATILSFRHFDGVEATARWGIGHGRGVIFIATSR